MTNEDEFDPLESYYGDCCLYCLYDRYLDLKDEMKVLLENDDGPSLVNSSKELKIVANEIHSRSLDEKLEFLRELSDEFDNEVHYGNLSVNIETFIATFLSKSN
jgi:hypothetical protein